MLDSATSENMPDGALVELCYVKTAEALSITNAATNPQILEALQIVRDGQHKGRPKDLIETLARSMGTDEEHLGPVITALSDAVASTLNPIPPSIPFASKLIAPSAFYESFDTIHTLGKLLLCPVIFAEDTEAIGTASINPMAAVILGDQIYQIVSKRFGIQPFLTTARMEYEPWAFLCRKHFEL
ncbi:MAG: hypothetical protein ACSHX7_04810 [Luteolibacter sp.]